MDTDKDLDRCDIDSGSDIYLGNTGFHSITATTCVLFSVVDTIVDTFKEDNDKDTDTKTIASFLQIQIWLQKNRRRRINRRTMTRLRIDSFL